MKNFVKFFLLLSLIGISLTPVFAHASGGTNNSVEKTGSGIVVKVTEKIPGANCSDKPNADKRYECTIQPGFSSVMVMLGGFIKYFTAITAIAGVLFIVINGITLSMGGLDSDAQQKAKDHIVRTIGGLVLLLFTGVILKAIAPWIFQ